MSDAQASECPASGVLLIEPLATKENKSEMSHPTTTIVEQLSTRAKKLELSALDSDSGRGQTTSESSSSGSDNDEQADFFVDASDVLATEEAGDSFKQPAGGHLAPQAHEDDAQQTKFAASSDQELGKSLGETADVLRLALSNEFNRAIDICEPRASRELYAGLAHATLAFLRAGLTLEPGDLQAAQASVLNSIEVSNRMRRQVSTVSMLARFLNPYNSRATVYEAHSDAEIHAELVSAESMLLHTLISFLADQSVICLVKSAFRIRSCHQRYKECLEALSVRQNWGSQEARRHFESGVRMGNGIFNLLMSYLPQRVLRFLEYVGFSGSRSHGIKELEQSIELADGLRSVLSALVILVYHSYVENLFGIGLYDEQKVRYLNERFLSTYPNSAFFLLFKGRYNQMTGDLDAAIVSFQDCIDAQDDWKQFHSICHWEMMWCHSVRMDWLSAAKYANLLRAHSKWSPASYTYQYASFLYAQLLQDERDGKLTSEQFEAKLSQVSQLMQSVPSLRIRYAGKTIPADKFAIERSMKFCKQNNRLALPALEFLYIWNIFCILKSNQQQVEKVLTFIGEERARLEQEARECAAKHVKSGENEKQQQQEEDDDDRNNTILADLCLIYLLYGMCQKHLGQRAEAEKSFKFVVENREKIIHTQEKFLVPHACMELTLLKVESKHYKEARDLIKSTRSDYTGYLLETIVHFRLHAASRLIRISAKDANHHQADDNDDGTQSEPSSESCPSTPSIGRAQC